MKSHALEGETCCYCHEAFEDEKLIVINGNGNTFCDDGCEDKFGRREAKVLSLNCHSHAMQVYDYPRYIRSKAESYDVSAGGIKRVQTVLFKTITELLGEIHDRRPRK